MFCLLVFILHIFVIFSVATNIAKKYAVWKHGKLPTHWQTFVAGFRNIIPLVSGIVTLFVALSKSKFEGYLILGIALSLFAPSRLQVILKILYYLISIFLGTLISVLILAVFIIALGIGVIGFVICSVYGFGLLICCKISDNEKFCKYYRDAAANIFYFLIIAPLISVPAFCFGTLIWFVQILWLVKFLFESAFQGRVQQDTWMIFVLSGLALPFELPKWCNRLYDFVRAINSMLYSNRLTMFLQPSWITFNRLVMFLTFMVAFLHTISNNVQQDYIQSVNMTSFDHCNPEIKNDKNLVDQYPDLFTLILWSSFALGLIHLIVEKMIFKEQDINALIFILDFPQDIPCEDPNLDWTMDDHLQHASFNGYHERVFDAIRFGANVNFINSNGCTSLHYASQEGHLDVVELLIQMKADIHVKNKEQLSAIHLACNSGHLEVVRYLIKRGAHLNDKDQNNRQPLHYACLGNHNPLVKLLMDSGADFEAIDMDGLTALQLLSQEDHCNVQIYLAGGKYDIKYSKF